MEVYYQGRKNLNLGSSEKDILEKHLQELSKNEIKKLNLYGTLIKSEGCKYLCEVLKINISLIKLDLGRTNIGVEGCKYLSEVLQACNILQELYLEGNNIGDEGCKYLSEALKINNSLQILYLDQNNIGNEGCKYLCEALKLNYSLHELELGTNKFDETACQYFSEVLKTNELLQILYLRNNKIGNEGCKFLNEALKFNSTLRELFLYDTQIGNELLKEIDEKLNLNKKYYIKFKKEKVDWQQVNQEWNLRILIMENCKLTKIEIDLKRFKKLEILDLRNNNLDDTLIDSLCEFIKWNPSLKILNLQGNVKIGDNEGKKLLSALSFNMTLIKCNLLGTSVSIQLQETIRHQIKFNTFLRTTELNGICSRYSELAELIILNKITEIKIILVKELNSVQTLQEILFICCAWNAIELVEFVLSQNIININFQLEDGNTYLHLSVMKDNYGVSILLLEKGIDTTILNKNGKSCKDLCISNGKCLSLFEDVKQLKVVILGKGEVGKTTLVNKILNPKKKLKERIKSKFISEKDSRTDGIEMYEWFTGLNNNNIIQLWDFGGQELFYTTHQFFLSKNSIHLLLFNLTDPLMDKELFFWLNSIQCRAPKSKVIIIGSHMDKIDPKLMEEEINLTSNKIKNIYDKIIKNVSDPLNNNSDNRIEIVPCSYWENLKLKEIFSNSNEKIWFYPISGINGWNIKHLENLIRKFSFNTVVRKEFIELKDKIISIRNQKLNSGKNPILLRDELISIILEHFKHEEIERALKLLHELGFILDFGMKYIIIYPQWLSHVFKSVVSLKNKKQIKNGMISRKQIFNNLQKELKFTTQNMIEKLSEFENAASIEDNEKFEFLLELMEKFELCIPKPKEKDEKNRVKESLMVIPCLLEIERVEGVDSIFNGSDTEILKRKYLFPFIPRGIFESMFGKICSFVGANIRFWKNGFYIIADEDKGHLMFEIKLPEYPENTKVQADNRSLIEIKSAGFLNHYLISAFHFCIKELFERQYPLIWKSVEIEIEYSFKGDKYNNYLQNCINLYKTTKEVKLDHRLLIPWIKLIPEEVEKSSTNVPSFDKLIVDSTKFLPAYKLGEGSSAEIFVCRALNLPGLFAIKQFKIMKELDETRKLKIVESFDRELKILKALDHPNLTKLIGFDQRGDNWLLVFPLYHNSLEGIQDQIFKKFIQPLKLTKFPLENKEVQENYWWTKNEILFFYQEILKGLEYLHSNLIVHLDLKLENILVYLDGEELILDPNNHNKRFNIKSIYIHDFGTAHKLDDKNAKISKYIGSFYHMAPEIRLWNPDKVALYKQTETSNSYNPFKADIFSFGILLCEIIANTSRLYHVNGLNKLKDHKFEKIILNCLKEDPNVRPTTNELLQFK